MKDATLCYPCRGNPAEQVLLGLKKRGFGQGKYVGFGGKIEAGETAEEAAVRELAEEAGITAAIESLTWMAHLTFLFPHKPEWDHAVHAFLVKDWQGRAQESGEMKPAWFPVARIPYERMWDDSAYWLPLVLAGQRFTAHFTFNADNDTVAVAEIKPWE